MENERREAYRTEHNLHSYSTKPESNPFAGKVICGTCNHAFTRRGWKTKGEYRKVWQCQERYKEKGVLGCSSRHVDEEVLSKAFMLSWKSMIANNEDLKRRWETLAEFGSPLEQYRSIQFTDQIDSIVLKGTIGPDMILRTLDHAKIHEDGRIIVTFMDGTRTEHERGI